MAKVVHRSLLLCFGILAICPAITSQDTLLAPTSVPLQEWLNGPDRQDIAWKVQIFQDMTLQQRHLVQVLATISGYDYFDGVSSRDLHFVTKVADERGNWLDGESYTHLVPPADFSQSDAVHAFANLYLRPGNYTLAMIAYDSAHGVGNVWRTSLSVAPVSAPLDGLDRDFPVVEFLPPAAAALSLKKSDWETSPPAVLQSLMLDPLTLGHGVAHLPVANKKPVRIDVIANLSNNLKVVMNWMLLGCGRMPLDEQPLPWSECYHPKFSEQDSASYKFDQGLALEVGNLVSQLVPQSGCVRFSAMDVLRQDLVADRVDASQVDWDSLSKKLASTDLKGIDLDMRPQHAWEHLMAFKQFVEKVNKDDYACGLPLASTDHVVIIVSLLVPFPPSQLRWWPLSAKMDTVKSFKPRPAYYHLLQSGKRGASPSQDPTEQMLSPLKPKFLPFLGSDQLRQQLDFIIKDLGTS